MRFLFTLLLLVFSLSVQAQSVLDTIRANIQTKIANLNTSQINTGILYDRTLPLANLQNYGFLEGATLLSEYIPNTSSLHYFQALEDLNHTDYQNRFPDAETTYNNNIATTGYINIGIINTDLNMFRDDAVDIGTLLIQGQDSLLYNNPNSSLSAYKTYQNSFIATPLKNFSGAAQPKFKFDEDFWLETAQYGITQLQADFDDGNGFVTVTKNQLITVVYSTFGEKQLKFKATFSNNKVKTVQVAFKMLGISIGLPQSESYIQSIGQCSFPVSATFSSGNRTFQGYNENQAYSGRGSYENFSGTTCITKPIIVVEGYDPSDGNGHFSLYTELNKSGLAVDLVSSGHDIITLNFEPRVINGKTVKGGTDYIERNAMVLVKLIEMVNASKSSNAEPTKVIGFSMGGLVARYALRYMELNSIPHDVDLYVSVDSPHQGANVPSGVQHTIKLIDDLVPAWLDPELTNLEDELNHPATKQMLKYHYKNSPFYNTFYNNLNTMGYPQNTRNIAVVNGSMSGTEINNINQRYYEGKAHLFWIVFNGKLRMNFTHNSGTARVFYWRMKLLGITIHKREKNISTNSSVGSLENAPAGYVGLDDLDDRILDFTELGLNWIVIGMKQKLSAEEFSFIPTKSAIDFIGSSPYLYQPLLYNLVCMGHTPFDSYYSTPSVNEPHMYLSEYASGFVYQEILGNPQNPYPGGSGGQIPYGGSYTVHPPNGGTYDLQTAWGDNYLPGDGDPLNLPVPQRVWVYPNVPTGSTNPYWEVYSDPDGAIHSWGQAGHVMNFYFIPNKLDSEIAFKFNVTNECGDPEFTHVKFIIQEVNGILSLEPEDSFLVYPVPADNFINIQSLNTTFNNEIVELYDLNGTKIFSNYISATSLTAQFDTSHLKNGIYFIKIVSEEKEIIKTIYIRH
ncbi:MAG TPA: T9SS type A sorting domain-containing protein [Flavobacteriaceae bacterium]|nr:T9SS type A sorting domain-containing protein [Flavobacteriaceae bacterium]